MALPPLLPDFRAAICAALVALDELRVVVGDNIYPSRVPQSADGAPSVGFRLVELVEGQTLSSPTGVATFRVVVEASSTDPEDATAAIAAIRASWRCLIGARWGDCWIDYILHDGELDEDPDELADGSDDATYRILDQYRGRVRAPLN